MVQRIHMLGSRRIALVLILALILILSAIGHFTLRHPVLPELPLPPPVFREHNPTFANRYESVDVWRNDAYEETYVQSPNRPIMPDISQFRSMGEYLKQPIIGDYPGTENIFFMIKTGATELWRRLPVHMFTTLTRVPRFAMYSDMPASIGGYEVIDILQNVTQSTYDSDEFHQYRSLRELHQIHGVLDASDTNLNDGWNLDKWKNIPMLAHAYAVAPDADWFVMIDADSFFFMHNLAEYLATLDPDQRLYLGSAAAIGKYVFAHGGSGIVLSRAAVRDSIGTHPEWIEEFEKETFSHCCGDFMVAKMLKDKLGLEISRGSNYPSPGWKFQGNSFWDLELVPEKWCEPILTLHHVTSHEIELLWEYERLLGPDPPTITYGLMYHDWILPYIYDEVTDWNNRARDLAEIQPCESQTQCQAACQNRSNCLSWRYVARTEYCGLAKSIRLGMPVRDYIREHSDQDAMGATSGWMVERIRHMRSSKSCDLLSTQDDELPDRSEGWFLRAKPQAN